MKKLIAVATVACAASAIFAANAKKPTPEEWAARKAKAAEEFYKDTGGMLRDTRNQKGRIVYVNAQTSADEAWLRESAAYFGKAMKVRVDVERGSFAFPEVKMVGETTVFVIDDAKYPSILAAPDQGWVAVNVAPLREGAGQKTPFFRARVKKELTRALTAVAGGIDSGYPGNTVGPIAGIRGLDKYPDAELPVDVLRRFPKQLELRGITPYRETTYLDACTEGWAHAPTNAVEKDVWDYVHKMPTDPIKIKFDPKKGK